MFGQDGLVQQSLASIQQLNSQFHTRLEMAAVQVYMEGLHDLLDQNAKITNGLCQYHPVPDQSTLDSLQQQIQNNKYVASTQLNQFSSRSHVVQVLRVVHPSGQHNQLTLVDLAGSERIKKSRPIGSQVNESKHINQSLTCLGKCIQALGQNQPHVPYRDSKLTKLLQNSLGGNSKTLLLCCITNSGQNLEETLSTLQFGQRAMKVVNTLINNQSNKEN